MNKIFESIASMCIDATNMCVYSTHVIPASIEAIKSHGKLVGKHIEIKRISWSKLKSLIESYNWEYKEGYLCISGGSEFYDIQSELSKTYVIIDNMAYIPTIYGINKLEKYVESKLNLLKPDNYEI